MAMFEYTLRRVVVLSAVLSFVLVQYLPGFLLYSKPTYIGTFSQLLLLQLPIWTIWKVIIWPKFVSPLRNIPGPTGGSFWNGQFSVILKKPTGGPMIDWINTIPNNGLIRYLGLLNSERLILASPKALSEVLTTRSYDFIRPAEVTASLGRALGIGILLAEGEEHKFQRKHLMPAFAFRHIKDLYPIFWSKARENVEKMGELLDAPGEGKDTSLGDEQGKNEKNEEIANGGDEGTAVIEVQGWASRATLDIVGLAGMGKNFGAIQDPNNPLNQAYKKIFSPTRRRILLGVMGMVLPSWFVNALPFEENGNMDSAANTVRNTCRQLIREKKEKLDRKELTDVDILSVALESGAFTEENLADQMMTFLAAGHETTASSMTWALYMLCLHPEVQTRLRAEIRAHLPSWSAGAGGEEVTSQEIDHMPYLNAVCSEVLRYYAPVPLTPRVAARDTTILGQFVPKGTRVMLIPWAVNRSEKLWGPDAGKFNPDRWLPSENNPHSANGGASSNYSFLTFLHGPRSCIGQGFARGEFACLLAAWVGKFEFKLNDESEMDEEKMDIKGGATSRPAKGLYVKMRAAEPW